MSDIKQLDIKQLAEKLVNLTVKDVVELAKILREVYGIEPAAAVAMAPAASQGGDKVAAEEKTSFDVALELAGDKKLQVVKAIKEITGLGLSEAKSNVDGATAEKPFIVKNGISKQEAEELIKALTEAGAQVKIV